MKMISMILLTVLLGKGCSEEQQKDLAEAKLEYTANTRGFYFKITIQDKKALVSRDREGQYPPEVRQITDEDWKTLVKEFNGVNLDSLPTLVAPSQKRFYDGAMIANLKVTYKGKEYLTPDFDHGIEPEPIKELVNRILQYQPPRR